MYDTRNDVYNTGNDKVNRTKHVRQSSGTEGDFQSSDLQITTTYDSFNKKMPYKSNKTSSTGPADSLAIQPKT